MLQELLSKDKTMAVLGLGYVGLPIALEFAKHMRVIGFDIKPERIDLMRQGIDPSNELDSSDFEGRDIFFTADPENLKQAQFFIVAVPTPIDRHNMPDLTPLIKSSQTVGSVLKKGDYVVYESTVYPGCTEEDCVPILEQVSGLRYNADFKVGYSPERINPGDTEHTLTKILKIVSGSDTESAQAIAAVYGHIVEPGVYMAETIRVAEAAKIIENTQRDVNIALMNELAVIFDKMGINTHDVLKAAGTKWNFLKFWPGLVGGHCIGVDPYYLTHKAKELGYHARMINAGRAINDSMGEYIAQQSVKKIIGSGKAIKGSSVLIMGFTFKENVSDIRNTKVIDVKIELESYGIKVDVYDPQASSEEVEHEYGFPLINEPKGKYAAVIVAVNHSDFTDLDEAYFQSLLIDRSLVIDIKGIYRNKFRNIEYWAL
jgi:UDP-N-acetyl-D-glucosamine/UDP-N-acetyl-D-galactosamine dehydrogenase